MISVGWVLQSNVLLTVITEFCAEYRTLIEGQSENLSSSELSGGARISFVFHEIFTGTIREVDPFDQLSDTDIRTILYNSSGSSPALFVSGQSFEVLVRQQIKRLEDPSFQCVALIHEELNRILGQLELKKVFKRFPVLKERFHIAVTNFFHTALVPTNKLVGDLLKSEGSYINTAHPDFLSGHRAMAIINERLTLGKVQAMEKQLQTAQKLQQAAQNPGQPGKQSPSPAAEVSPQLVSAVMETPQYLRNDTNSGFFGSFFSGKPKAKQSQPVLEAVSFPGSSFPNYVIRRYSPSFSFFLSFFSFLLFSSFRFFCAAPHLSEGNRKPVRTRENGNRGDQ